MIAKESRGSVISHYTILEEVGHGGMGTVYRARDTRLGRTVALKFLKLNQDADPNSTVPNPSSPNPSSPRHWEHRLEEEARVISLLNHPYICTLYDYGVIDGQIFLVMEYIEGETLARRMAGGPMPFADCVRIGIEICQALRHAHEKGVVHRDLKPANIMLTRNGIKLLDFGIAKRDQPSNSDDTALITTGAVIGSLPYMSPEQVQAKPIDARSDLFSFGVILHEMCTGQRLFAGGSSAEVAARILKDDVPPVSTVRPEISKTFDRVLQRCLARDPANRWQSALDLGETLATLDREPTAMTKLMRSPQISRGTWRRVGAALGVFALGFLSAWLIFSGARRTSPAAFTSLTIEAPDGLRFALATDFGGAALSPDGRLLAFAPNGETPSRLWLRPMNKPDAYPLKGTEGGFAPFWSPNSDYIAFFAGGKLKKIHVDDGVVEIICDAAQGRGGSWNEQGQILLTPAEVGGPESDLQTVEHLVPASGGTPQPLGKLNRQRGENAHVWPVFLPGTQKYLYLARSNHLETQALFAADLNGHGTPQLLRPMQSNVAYSDGHLIFFQDGKLLAQKFNPATLAFSGEPRLLADKVGFTPSMRYAFFSAARDGTLIYSGAQSEIRNISLVNRSGQLVRNFPEPSAYYSPKISPAGDRLFISRFTPFGLNADLWQGNLMDGGLTRFTFEDSHEAAPIWSPDGTQVAYSVIDGGIFHLVKRAIYAAGAPVPLNELSTAVMRPYDWTRDGKTILYGRTDNRNRSHIWAVAINEGNRNYPITDGTANELYPQLSADGNWLAYSSDVSGVFEVYLGRMGDQSVKWQVSNGGGWMPRWRRDGKELYFVNGAGQLMAVPITTEGRELRIGVPYKLLAVSLSSRQRMSYNYDVTPDGKIFLLLTPVEDAEQKLIHVLLNWNQTEQRR